MRSLVLLALVPLLLGCGGAQSGEDPAPHITPQAGADLCDEACAKMTTLTRLGEVGPVVGCLEAQDTVLKDGGVRTCTEQCVYDHENGVAWGTECISTKATTCEEVETVCNTQS